MAGFNMGGILKKMLGGDINKMDDQQLAEAVERVRQSTPPKQNTGIDKLKALPIKEWRELPYAVRLVRFVPRQGVQPCEICGQLVGRLSDLMDARFFIEKAEQDHPAPFCLTVDPVTAWPGNPMGLPEAPEEECGDILNSMDLTKVNDDIYYREHPRR